MKPVHTVCLIIDSDRPWTTHYEYARNTWKQYMNLDPEIKCFFIRFQKDLEEEVIFNEENNEILFKGHDGYRPQILLKTILAMTIIDEKYDYKYLIRTNVSTVWNFNLFKTLFNEYEDNFCGGPFVRDSGLEYISGYAIILSKNLVAHMIKNKYAYRYDLWDDQAIGVFLKDKGIILKNLENKTAIFSHSIEKSDFSELIDGIKDTKFIFRVRYDRGEQDRFIYKNLLRTIHPDI